MAHSCPDCGEMCFCGGDVDDILFEDSDDADECEHCPEGQFSEITDDDSWEATE